MKYLLDMLMLKDLNSLGKLWFWLLVLIAFFNPHFVTVLAPIVLIILARIVKNWDCE